MTHQKDIKPSEIFEGENSSLRKTFNKATKEPAYIGGVDFGKSEDYKEKIVAEMKTQPFIIMNPQHYISEAGDVHLETVDWDKLESFILSKYEHGKADGIKESNIKIGMLRQWLNEDRITDPKKMVTNEDIKHWIGDSFSDYKRGLVIRIEAVKNATREQSGAFKYDACYDEIIQLIQK